MAFPPVRTRELNDFVLAVLEDLDKGEPTDNITPDYPLWRRMIENNGGMVDKRSPGHGPVEDLLYQTPDITQVLSQSRDAITEDPVNVEGYTQAKFDWVQVQLFLLMGKVERDNAQGKNAIADLVMRKKKLLDKSFKKKLNTILWNGITSGSEKVFGLLDYVKVDPSTNPAKGNIGGIDASVAAQSWWRNLSYDFASAYKTINSGTHYLNLLADGATSMNALYRALSYVDGAPEHGEPDLFLINDILDNMWVDMVQNKVMYQNKEDKHNLGYKTYMYKNAAILYDASVPTETASEGCGMFVNTSNIKFAYAEGLEKRWEDAEKVAGKSAFQWPCWVQLSTTCDERRTSGWIHGITAAT